MPLGSDPPHRRSLPWHGGAFRHQTAPTTTGRARTSHLTEEGAGGLRLSPGRVDHQIGRKAEEEAAEHPHSVRIHDRRRPLANSSPITYRIAPAASARNRRTRTRS